jgi:hypothetical protein
MFLHYLSSFCLTNLCDDRKNVLQVEMPFCGKYTTPYNVNMLFGAAKNIELDLTPKAIEFNPFRHMQSVCMLPSPSSPTKKGVRRPERESCSLCFRTRTPMDLRESPASRL